MPPKRPSLTWPFGLYRVAGHSMQPTYQPGDTLLGWRWARGVQAGQVLVIRRNGAPIIKRLAARDAAGALILAGDNPADSLDSRQFGAVPPSAIIARIITKLP